MGVELPLTVRDRRILYELDRNPRASFSALARKIRINRNTLEYRYRQLLESKVLTNVYAIVNSFDLGYEYYKLYFRTRSVSADFKLSTLNVPGLVWAAKTDGQYDLVITIMVRDGNELEDALKVIRSKIKVREQSLQVLNRVTVFDEKWLGTFGVPHSIVNQSTKEQQVLDESDKKIIKEMVGGARVSLVDLGQIVGLTPEAVKARIRNLERKKILTGYKARINYSKLGFDYFHVLLGVSDYEGRKRICEFLKTLPYCVCVVETTGTYDIQAEFISRGHSDVSSALEQIKKNFSTYLERTDALFIIEEISIRTF
ncbi:MAG: AsnC family transcriptional regulator [Candidatus Woesearchaeota archaeon]